MRANAAVLDVIASIAQRTKRMTGEMVSDGTRYPEFRSHLEQTSAKVSSHPKFLFCYITELHAVMREASEADQSWDTTETGVYAVGRRHVTRMRDSYADWLRSGAPAMQLPPGSAMAVRAEQREPPR